MLRNYAQNQQNNWIWLCKYFRICFKKDNFINNPLTIHEFAPQNNFFRQFLALNFNSICSRKIRFENGHKFHSAIEGICAGASKAFANAEWAGGGRRVWRPTAEEEDELQDGHCAEHWSEAETDRSDQRDWLIVLWEPSRNVAWKIFQGGTFPKSIFRNVFFKKCDV